MNIYPISLRVWQYRPIVYAGQIHSQHILCIDVVSGSGVSFGSWVSTPSRYSGMYLAMHVYIGKLNRQESRLEDVEIVSRLSRIFADPPRTPPLRLL